MASSIGEDANDLSAGLDLAVSRSSGLVTGTRVGGAGLSGRGRAVPTYGAIRDKDTGSTKVRTGR
jgi:hypothetical protein